MDITRLPDKWQFAHVYLDDVVVFSHSTCHIRHVTRVLSLSQAAGATLILEISNFFTGKTDYFGHLIRKRRLEIAAHLIKTIKIETTDERTKVHSFYVLCNILRRFVPNFAGIATPLNQKFKKN